MLPPSPREFQTVLSDLLADTGNQLGKLATLTLSMLKRVEQIAVHTTSNPAVQPAATLLGRGQVSPSAGSPGR